MGKGGPPHDLDRKVADRRLAAERDIRGDDPSPQMCGSERKTFPKGARLEKRGRKRLGGWDRRRKNPESGRSGVEKQPSDREAALKNIAKTDFGRDGRNIDIGGRMRSAPGRLPDRDGEAVHRRRIPGRMAACREKKEKKGEKSSGSPEGRKEVRRFDASEEIPGRGFPVLFGQGLRPG